MSASPPPQSRTDRGRRIRALVVLVAGVALAAAILVADARFTPGEPPAAEPVAQEPATSGWWHCPVTAEEDETVLLAIAAAGDTASEAVVVHHAGGAPQRDEARTVEPGDQAVVRLTGAAASQPVSVEWRGGPVAVHWTVQGERTSGAPCATGDSQSWYLTGLDTTLGSASTLHVLNPFSVDAVVRVRFGTDEGPVDLVRTENIAVEAGRAVQLDLNDLQPEEADLAVVVDVLAGRAFVQGEVERGAPGEDPAPEGRTLLPAAAAPMQSAGFAYVGSNERTASWLSIYNPGERDTAVTVRVTDAAPETDPLTEVTVTAGSVVRLDMDGFATEAVFGVALEAVTDVPFVASRITDTRAGPRQGVGASVAASAEQHWVVPGWRAGGRSGLVSVYNAGGEAATVQVSAGEATPGEWNALTLRPNTRVVLDLGPLPAPESGWPVVVQASAPVIVEHRAVEAETPDLGLVTATGVPVAPLTGPSQRPPVQREPGLIVPRAPMAQD